MLYSTITGAIIMFVINSFAFFLTAGFVFLFAWLIGIILAAVAANNHNKKLGSNNIIYFQSNYLNYEALYTLSCTFFVTKMCLNVHAQSIDSSVLAASGKHYQYNEDNLQFTLGETFRLLSKKVIN
jgi:hypothetical protein